MDGGGGLAPVQVADVPDPLVHGPGVPAPDLLDPPALAAGGARLLADHPHVQLQHAGVTLPGARLIQDLKIITTNIEFEWKFKLKASMQFQILRHFKIPTSNQTVWRHLIHLVT